MFITCQTDMDFGMDHNTAMDAQVLFTALGVAGVQEFLQANAMDFIVWACGLERTPEDQFTREGH